MPPPSPVVAAAAEPRPAACPSHSPCRKGVWGLTRVAKKEVPRLLTKEEKVAKKKAQKGMEKSGVSINDDDPDMETREVVMMDRNFVALR